MHRLLAAVIVALALATSAQAQGTQPQAASPGTPPGTVPTTQSTPMAGMASPDTPADRSFAEGMAKMHESMMAVHDTGKTDRDFVLNMIPHHQGAVDMAQTEIRYGKDPGLRRLAQSIVVDQRREIAQMQAWLTAHPSH